jgi:hypothetical protein
VTWPLSDIAAINGVATIEGAHITGGNAGEFQACLQIPANMKRTRERVEVTSARYNGLMGGDISAIATFKLTRLNGVLLGEV